jgi:beta-1,4-mannosyltransferase
VINILAKPAFRSPNGESSSYLIADILNSDEKINVSDWNKPFDFIKKKPNLIILHWPDNILGYNIFKFYTTLGLLIFSLLLAKLLFKTKHVWFAHNIKSHHKVSKAREKIFWKWFLMTIDFIIYPLPTILEIHNENIFEGDKKIIPFGPYTKRLVDFENLENLKLEIGYDNQFKYFLWFGLIRPYKNLEFLIDVFDKSNDNFKLLIVGQVSDEKYYKSLSKSKNVVFLPRFIEDSEFPLFFNLSDACIFNYNNITNSGSIRMALTYNKPVFCNYFKQFEDFNEILDTNLVQFYNSSEELSSHLTNFTNFKFNSPNWENSSWDLFKNKFKENVIDSL